MSSNTFSKKAGPGLFKLLIMEPHEIVHFYNSNSISTIVELKISDAAIRREERKMKKVNSKFIFFWDEDIVAVDSKGEHKLPMDILEDLKNHVTEPAKLLIIENRILTHIGAQ